MKFKALISLILLAAAALGQGLTVITQTDITGTGATVKLLPNTASSAQWVQFGAVRTNSSDVRWGDSNTAIARGMFMAPGGGQSIARNATYPAFSADPTTIYIYIANGDKVSVTWAQ